ncbi:MAG: HAMP domain-containing histidine kinase [Actinomycetota bacterium]|nr:HAMP domain-containing histidine kinase [Actinomycetota bacterium]
MIGRRRFNRLPIRWRLALTSAVLTLVILATFAVVMGAFTAERLRDDFDNDVRARAADLKDRIRVAREFPSGRVILEQDDLVQVIVNVAASGDGAVRVIDTEGEIIAPSRGAPALGPPGEGIREVGPYRVASEPLYAGSLVPVAYLQYGKESRGLGATLDRLRIFLALGVLAGTGLALLAGLAVARRAMAPVGRLTRAAKHVAQTRNPTVSLPKPPSEDEVADLARTLEEMLHALDQAQGETESALRRQREFVADASHELRTPLTAVLANLELLEASLEGEDRELASSALRSSRRMRGLVADLLLLARADAGHRLAREVVNLSQVVREAGGEVAPLALDHELSVSTPEGRGSDEPILVEGSGDELHRLTRNLLENAVVHTPPGTRVEATLSRDDATAVLDVRDDGPGVPFELRGRVFERFVRGDSDNGARGGTGLGLAIVRAVAERHGGSVEVGVAPAGGARFTVRLPARLGIATGSGPEVRAPEPAA